MKAKYLDDLRRKLEEFQAAKSDIDEIINDYGQLYDDALASGRTDEEVYQSLGDPHHVAYELIDTLRIKHKKNVRNKIVALMPFISVITFMGIGLATDIWHPTWLVFLSIPVTAIILNTRTKDMLVSLSPFASVIVFMLLGTYKGLWNPGWLVFLSIPMLGLVQSKHRFKALIQFSAFAIAIAFYLYWGYTTGQWQVAALGFALPIVTLILFGDIGFNWDLPKDGPERRKALLMLSVVITCVIVFLLVGYFLDGWLYAWQVFVFIPVSAILFFNKKLQLTPLMPFVAVMLFFNLGYFLDLWVISWIAFLLIPIVAIIENA